MKKRFAAGALAAAIALGGVATPSAHAEDWDLKDMTTFGLVSGSSKTPFINNSVLRWLNPAFWLFALEGFVSGSSAAKNDGYTDDNFDAWGSSTTYDNNGATKKVGWLALWDQLVHSANLGPLLSTLKDSK